MNTKKCGRGDNDWNIVLFLTTSIVEHSISERLHHNVAHSEIVLEG